MGEVIGDVVPAALGLLLVNPLPILAIILLLFSPRASVTAPAFVIGWIVGLIVAMSVLLWAVQAEARLLSGREASLLGAVLKIVLGAVLLLLAFRKWEGRPQDGEPGKLPGWVQSLEQASPPTTFGIGAAFSGLNPKNFAFTLATVLTIAEAGLLPREALVPGILYVVIGSLGVAAPVIWYLTSPESASATLTKWRDWLTANYAVMMSVILVLFGVTLLARGFGSLLG
jgi:threonine/homoserine/homoserine lactone efflux protein